MRTSNDSTARYEKACLTPLSSEIWTRYANTYIAFNETTTMNDQTWRSVDYRRLPSKKLPTRWQHNYNPLLLNGPKNRGDYRYRWVLHLSEVYNLELTADLVVLSACETGLGKVNRGEGIISMTRGFLYSGARNVVVSTWTAPDRATTMIMQDFYRRIADGQDYARALQAAKLKYMSRGYLPSRPSAWASFILVGE